MSGFDGAARPDFWVRHIQMGVVLTDVACALGVLYAIGSIDDVSTTGVVAVALVVGGVSTTLLALPLRRLVTHPRVALFFYGWSSVAAVGGTTACLLSGGPKSPFVAYYFLMLVYATTAYPPRVQIHTAVMMIGAYTLIATTEPDLWASSTVIAVTLGLTAWMCSIASRNQWRQVEEQRTLARVDSLTGCLTRRAFDEALAAAADDSHRHRQPLSVILIDIDHFKAVNDEDGHQAGDEVLAALGVLLHETIRRVDVAGRIGGDEFAVILPGTDATGAVEVAQRILDAHEGSRTTVSIGVATARQRTTAERLLNEADEALYDAKAAGRDRVTLHDAS